MHRFSSTMLCLLFCLAFVPRTSAQTDPVDSLAKVITNTANTPEQRKKALSEMVALQRERNRAAITARPQQSLLRDAGFWVEELGERQDSIVDQLIALVSTDTLAHLPEKEEAIRLLAKSGKQKAYAFLMDNFGFEVPYSSSGDEVFYRERVCYWYLSKEPAGNWALFPEIIRVLSASRQDEFSIELLTILLDRVFQDPPLLVATLNLYARKEQHNDIFEENRKKVVEALQNMH